MLRAREFGGTELALMARVNCSGLLRARQLLLSCRRTFTEPFGTALPVSVCQSRDSLGKGFNLLYVLI
jgi:hypothetical protein